MAAEGTFTLRAVDATRQAFANIQNSFGRLNNTALTISKTLKFAFGANVFGSALKAINNQLDSVIDKQNELGFSEKDVRAAMEMEAAIDGILKMLMQIPVAAGKFGIEIANSIGVLDPAKVDERLRTLRLARDKKEVDDLTSAFSDLQNEFNSMGKSQGVLAFEARQRIVMLDRELQNIGSAKPVEQLKKMIEIEKLENSIKATSITISKELIDAEKEYMGNVIESQKQTGSKSDAIRGLSRDYSNLRDDILSAKEAIAAYEESGGQVEEAQERLINLYRESVQVAQKLNPLLKEQGKLAMEAGQIIASGFEDAIFSGQKLGEVIKAIGLDLMRMVFQQTVTAPLAKGISGAILEAFKPRAMGGPVSAGSPYMVGERGPELFVPHASGSIVPNGSMSSSGGSSGGVTVNYNIAAGVTRNELAPILEQERRRLKAEIPDMVRRGGAYRSAFA
jgi:hypothetical protein